ncbi:MAG: hypothetical protein NXH88_09215 [Hyphomonas sp.]|nr:hypothetical protein [Hyphomonas sp.]
MARTVADLAKRTLQKLHVVEGEETPNAEDQALVITAFNDFVDGLFADGLTPYADETATTKVALVEATTYTNASDFPFLERHFEGVAAVLAVNLEEDLADGKLGASVYRQAMTGRQRIDAAFMPSMIATVDRALRRMPSSVLWPSDT